MAARLHVLSLFRQCLKELKTLEEMKKGHLEHLVWQKSPIYQHLKQSIHSNVMNTSLLETYVYMLHGNRRSQELIAKYRGVGERSIEETATIVGLKLPKLYEDEKS